MDIEEAVRWCMRNVGYIEDRIAIRVANTDQSVFFIGGLPGFAIGASLGISLQVGSWLDTRQKALANQSNV